MSFCANFEGCAAKTLGGVGFLLKAYFSLPQCCQFLAHGCQNWDIDLKFEMGGRIDTISMWVKFGDDPISSLDFNFTGGCTLKSEGEDQSGANICSFIIGHACFFSFFHLGSCKLIHIFFGRIQRKKHGYRTPHLFPIHSKYT